MPQPLKPTAVLKLEKGKLYDEQRDRATLEPKPVRELKPRCPKRFSKEERKAWREIAKVLKNYGLFTAANAVQLELLATAWAQYLECCQKMAETKNIIVKGPDGGAMYNPYFNAQHKLAQMVDRYSQNLGLSSIALAKIGSFSLRARKQKSEMEDLLD
jgi:P27 family predicted phage terminase small subunit